MATTSSATATTSAMWRLALVVTAVVAALLTPTDVAAADAANDAWIDTFDRQAVIDHHEAAFNGDVPDLGWTGDLSTCAAGTTNPEYRSATIDRVNWFRAMAGLGPVNEDADLSAKAQEAAAMFAADRRPLSHEREVVADYACQTPTAIGAVAKSNLHRGNSGPTAITRYIRDDGLNNESVRHRTWVLNPSAHQFGTGDVPRGDNTNATNVLWIDDEASTAPAATRDEFIAWPNSGFVPSTSVHPRWSFALPRPSGVDISAAEVLMQRFDNGSLSAAISAPVIYQDFAGGARVDVIVWEPGLEFEGPDLSLVTPAVDTTYRITISNIVSESGTVVTYRYDVTVIGDNAATDGPQASVREEIAAATPNQAFIDKAHQDFLGRPANDAELADWSSRIDQGSSESELVSELSLSVEWMTRTVDTMYEDTLGRRADPAGRDFWINQLKNGTTVADMAAHFYSSDEYRLRHGNDVARWVEDLYVRLLARPADNEGLAFWVNQVELTSPLRVARQLYQSDESARVRVKALYAKLLDRTPDAGGEEFWARELQETGDDLALAATLAASLEYRTRAATGR